MFAVGVVTSVTEHNCGGYCDECATELWESVPQKDKVFYMRMTSLYERYTDLLMEYEDGARGGMFVKHFNETTQQFHIAMEIMQLECGMDDK